MQIRFLTDFVYRTAHPDGDPFYQAGQTYEIREDRAKKWIREGLAVAASAPVTETPARAARSRAATEAEPTPAGRAELRAARGADLDDPGTGAPPPPNPMRLSDMPQPSRAGPPTPRDEKAAVVAPAGQDEPLESMLREELLELVEKRGIETPAGYLSKPTLIRLLRGLPTHA
jgi:hypothetical protein